MKWYQISSTALERSGIPKRIEVLRSRVSYMTKPEEVRCECWAHCKITRRQEVERCAAVVKSWLAPGTMALLRVDALAEDMLKKILREIEEG
jgi:hypothetical protein